MREVIEVLKDNLTPTYQNVYNLIESECKVNKSYVRLAANLARQLISFKKTKFNEFLSELDTFIRNNSVSANFDNPDIFLEVCRKIGTCHYCGKGRLFCLINDNIIQEEYIYGLLRVDTLTNMHYRIYPSSPVGGTNNAINKVKKALAKKESFEMAGYSNPFLFVAKIDDDLIKLIEDKDTTSVINYLGLEQYIDFTENLVVTIYPNTVTFNKISKPTIIQGWNYPPFRVDATNDKWGKAIHLETGLPAASEACHCPIMTNKQFNYDIWSAPGKINFDEIKMLEGTINIR